MPKRKPALVADLFCGAGGSSSGARKALAARGIDMQLVAVNHWPIAIETHQLNHPDARHYCVNLDAARPEELVPEGELDLLMASPECTHHSRARGGKPIHDQSRMSAWHIIRWASVLYVRRILIENVPEFREWAPLGANGRPLKSKKGNTYRAFVRALEEIGYTVEDRVLNAADYGDATTRERLFIMARLRGKIIWPVPSHAKKAYVDEGGNVRQPWRAAREIIDWSIEGKSIFDRKKPLAANTIRRIAAGLRKFGGSAADPFLVILRNHCDAMSIDCPLPTITASGTHIALAQLSIDPFLTPFNGEKNGQPRASRSIDDPVATITTEPRFGLAEPYIIQVNHGDGAGTPDRRARSIDDPLPTVTTKHGMAVVEPFLLGQQSCAAPRSVDQPTPTIATAGKISLTEAVLVNMKGKSNGASVDAPAPSITAHAQHLGIAQPVLVQIDQTGSKGSCTRSVDSPVPTLVTKQNVALVEPFITSFYGNNKGGASIDRPLDTVTTKDRHALVRPFLVPQFGEREGQQPRTHSIDAPLPAVTSHGAGALVEAVASDTSGRLVKIGEDYFLLDIRFRMLRNKELARAMGFSDEETEYEFCGNGEQITRQIGNAVPVNTAAALVAALMEK